jgi:hypothetical protein
VPLSGARSFVFSTACASLCTVSLALFTAARADARFASRVAVLTLEPVAEPAAPVEEAEVGLAVWLAFVGCAFVVVVLLLGEVAVGVAVWEALAPPTDAVEADPAPPPPDPLELCPFELSPLVSSSLARLASAD